MNLTCNNFYFVAKKIDNYRLNLSSLYDLYLPIVGKTATSFYILLNNIIDNSSKNINLTFNSDGICHQLNVDIQKLLDAKNKLEAIGLLTTYISINNDDKKYILVINSALTYNEFILNPKFKKLLILKTGSTNYEYLQYKNSQSTSISNSINVTTNFESIFDNKELDNVRLIDFEKIYLNIQKNTNQLITISEPCKQIIIDVYKKYSFSLSDIEKVICKSIYKLPNHNDVNASLLLQNFNEIISGNITKTFISINRNKKIFYSQLSPIEENDIIRDYEICNSELYLSSIFKKNLNDDEKNIINTLKHKYYLKDEIINVLIDFSLYKTNGKLNKLYLIKAAHTINGLNLITIRQIINHFRNAVINKNQFVENDYKLESI